MPFYEPPPLRGFGSGSDHFDILPCVARDRIPAKGGFFGGDACGCAFMTNLRLKKWSPPASPLSPPLWYRRSCPPLRRGLTRQGLLWGTASPPLTGGEHLVNRRGEVLRRGGIPSQGPRSAPHFAHSNHRMAPLGRSLKRGGETLRRREVTLRRHVPPKGTS